jgi:pantoate--beta-alanine ligase
MSSRNQLLSNEGFIEAGFLFKMLMYVQLWSNDTKVEQIKSEIQKAFSEHPTIDLEYFEIAHPETLVPVTDHAILDRARAFVVARLEGVRLIDNVALK